MKVKLNSGVEYWVSWDHHINPKDELPHTICQITNETNPEIFTEAIAILSKKDKFFVKNQGRIVSMKKAMQQIGLNKETRRLFWNIYWETTNKKQRIK